MTIQPLIIGHRGSSAVAPENTIAAFSQAISDGADGIEFDVRLSRDQVPVVIHDATLKRTASIKRAVAELTCDELRQIDAGAWFHGQSSRDQKSREQECVPSLEDVFRLYRQAAGHLYVEMKGEPVGKVLPAEVVRLIKEHSFIDRVIVESFDLAAIAAIKKIDESIRTAALFEPTVSERLSIPSRDLLSQASEVQADEIALHHTLARNEVVVAARRAGLEVVVWTVEQQKWVGLAQRLGIKALITNDPAAFLKHRAASQVT